MHILVVDDEHEICILLRKILCDEGHDVTISGTVHNCRSLLDRKFDVVLLDQKLPDGKGNELIPGIRAANPEVLIIIISAINTPEEITEAKELGADLFVDKPFRSSEILSALPG